MFAKFNKYLQIREFLHILILRKLTNSRTMAISNMKQMHLNMQDLSTNNNLGYVITQLVKQKNLKKQ